MDPVIEFIQLGSTPFKDSAILAPKLADPPFWWKSNPTPSKSGSGYLIWIDSYVVLFIDVYYSNNSYLETRTHCVNTSFIIQLSKMHFPWLLGHFDNSSLSHYPRNQGKRNSTPCLFNHNCSCLGMDNYSKLYIIKAPCYNKL